MTRHGFIETLDNFIRNIFLPGSEQQFRGSAAFSAYISGIRRRLISRYVSEYRIQNVGWSAANISKSNCDDPTARDVATTVNSWRVKIDCDVGPQLVFGSGLSVMRKFPRRNPEQESASAENGGYHDQKARIKLDTPVYAYLCFLVARGCLAAGIACTVIACGSLKDD
jgi:hypothetical protein